MACPPIHIQLVELEGLDNNLNGKVLAWEQAVLKTYIPQVEYRRVARWLKEAKACYLVRKSEWPELSKHLRQPKSKANQKVYFVVHAQFEACMQTHAKLAGVLHHDLDFLPSIECFTRISHSFVSTGTTTHPRFEPIEDSDNWDLSLSDLVDDDMDLDSMNAEDINELWINMGEATLSHFDIWDQNEEYLGPNYQYLN